MRQLLIETSTERGVIVCLENQQILFSEELPFGLNQSKFLIPALVKHPVENLSCIGVGIGPGSYTGIRIGVSVAQALAYVWKIPLIGVCSLDGFVPEQDGGFAAILDARIGGAYVRKGIKEGNQVRYLSEPQVCPLEELKGFLGDSTHLITPFAENIKNKMDALYPDNGWIWEERGPEVGILGGIVESLYKQGAWNKRGHLDLLYLRETEAERNRKS